ncbi:glycosyltransferase family 2 protein [Aeromicrobium sp. CTD01-1L150]|uniref:glycosyltransferase family 2 protein n=1 Tax=Aeromicrobium sp. CTD01-1L150 TaxID=3341830 RepID=UPI0035BEE17B
MDDVEEEVRPWLSAPPTVGAVLVAHDGATWLPKVLESFAGMDHAPTAWRVVDVASTDDGAELLRQSFGADRIQYAPSGTGFGAAAALGVAALPATDWIWFLHDDAAVDPDALAGLLDVATTADDIAVVGPKIREWPSLRRLLEVGLTITSTGSRETGLETGEPDAGQHDWPRDVLAVNTAGMLVRRDVWEELGGLDRALPLHFDDIDFGWRVARAGYRTRTAPGSVIFHAEASRRRTRRRSAGDPPTWDTRRAAMYTVLANTSGPRFVWAYLRLFLGTVLRFLGFLLAKDPESAGDELLALRAVYTHPLDLRAARRARAASSVRSQREVQSLLAPFWLPYRHGWDAFRGIVAALVRPETIETTGRRSTLGSGDPDDATDLDDGPPLWRRRPWLVTVLGLLVASLVAGRDMWGGGGGTSLLGGALPPTPDGAGQWWALLLERGHDVGLASTTFAPVFAGLLAAVATPVWFAPGLVVTVLMLLAVPLAGLSAHRLGRIISGHRGLRIVWAVTYAVSVAAIGAIAQGRIGTVVALVVLPIIANTALQLLERPGWQMGLRLGIWMAVGAAFAPVVLPLCLVGLLLLAVVERGLGRPVALAAVTSCVLLGPWVVQRALHPLRTWWEAGYPVPGQGAGALEALYLLLGRAGGPGQAPAWLGAGLVLLAVLALLPRATRTAVLVCWFVAVVGLCFAVLGSLVTFSVPGGSAPITPWVGVPVAVWILGLATAVLVAAPEWAGLARPAVVGLLVLALLAPVGSGLWWVVRGSDDPLDRARPDTVPAFLSERSGDTLVVAGTLAEGVDVRVVRGAGPVLGEEALHPDPQRRDELVAAAEGLLSSASPSHLRALADLGVESVYAPDVDPVVEQRIDAASQLEPAGSDRPGSRVWTLSLEAESHEAQAGIWRTGFGVLQIMVWLGAIIATAPVRRRDDARHDEEVRA